MQKMKQMPPPPKPVDLLAGETVVSLSSGSQSYTANTTTYIFGNTGTDTIDGGSTDLSTVDYSNLHEAVTLLPEGLVDKGTNGADGVDTLINIKTIVGAAGFNNIVDTSSITSTSIGLTVNLSAHTIAVSNIPGVGTLAFNIFNFETIIGTSGADTFVGDNGNDSFTGGAGSSFTTGRGTNMLTGGGANDVFNFGGGHDTITNFSLTSGDVINSQWALNSVTSIATGSTSGSVLHFAGGGSITLNGVSAASFVAAESSVLKIG